MRFEISESDKVITTHAGLSLVGELLAKTQLKERLNGIRLPGQTAPQLSNAEVAFSYIGLLCQGKSDFDHIEPFCRDKFYRLALDLREVPSSPTLRQRLDLAADSADWPTCSARRVGRPAAPHAHDDQPCVLALRRTGV